MPGDVDTLCGYTLSDVRKSLREAIDRRATRAANRWTAELVATPGAVGSLWASYWLAWAAAQGAGSASPTLPILLRQTWGRIAEKAHDYAGDWIAFRNDADVRAIAGEMTTRLINQSRQTPVVWPSRELILYDVSAMRDGPHPVQADGPAVLAIWRRNEDAMELRMMGGRWLASLEAGDIRTALSAVAWTLLPQAQQGLPLPLQIAERGPAALPPKIRTSPLWFWLELGRAWLAKRSDLHRGWPTMHAAIADAFKTNYKRWTAVERMRLLLAWILQLRASLLPQPPELWAAGPVVQTGTQIDLPYKEIAAELSDPASSIVRLQKSVAEKKVKVEDESKQAATSRTAAKMAEADAAVMAALGLSADDI